MGGCNADALCRICIIITVIVNCLNDFKNKRKVCILTQILVECYSKFL